jgi:hypothetical protein
MAMDLWGAMKEVWPLPACEDIQNTGSEWILHALSSTSEHVRMMMMMTWWRIWHVRNKVVHQKPAPPIEASRRYLCSYVDSLLCIKQNPTVNPTKGKTVVKYEHNGQVVEEESFELEAGQPNKMVQTCSRLVEA